MSGVVGSKSYDGRLRHPISFFIAGASGSGKSVWVKKLAENMDFLFDEKIDRVVWCYAHWQELFEDPTVKGAEFVKGFSMDLYEKGGGPKMVIIDDMVSELSSRKDFVNTFVTNRHANVTTVFLTQNVFQGGFRTCRLNATYVVLMKMVRDRQQIHTFFRQMFPDKMFKYAKAAVADATKEPYS